ncbi:hypothetical protein ABBQ32_005089 [Trebouxia sp. C0010 RCD-2024]
MHSSQPFAASSVQETWSAGAFDSLKLFSLHLTAIGGSGAAARTVVAPLERIKILLQVEGHSNLASRQRYGSFQNAVWQIYQREGFRGYYRGNGASVLRLLPDTAVKFALHDSFKVMFAPPDGRPLGLTGKLAAGSATGLIKCLSSYPLELAHTRLAADVSQMGQPRLYTGILHCLLETWQHEGTRGLYKGVLASAAGVVPYLAISFTMYDELQSRLPDNKDARSAWWYGLTKLGSGAAAGLVASTVVYPVDTVRRRMQVSGSPRHSVSYKGYWDCIRSMSRREGLTAFYRGAGVNALRIIPAAAVQFTTYDVLKYALLALDPSAASPL